MKFKSVQITNFGAIGDATVDLDERGLLLIQGDNQDDSSANSNGAGKSTIVEAISWCLYGKTAKGVTGDHVINRSAGKGCCVEVVLSDDSGEEYLIQRGRKHKTLKSKLHVTLKDGSSETDLTKGNDKLTQDAVDRIMGCPYEVFVAAVYSGQEAMPDLPNMTDKHLKLLIEEAAGITLLEQAHLIAKSRLNDARQKKELLERKAESAENNLRRAEERLEDSKEASRRWVAERDARVIDMENSAKRLLMDAKAHKKTLEDLRSEEDIEEDQRKLRERLDRRDREVDELATLEKAANAAEHKAALAKAEAERGGKQVKNAKADLEDLRSQLGEPCHSCGRPHDEASLASSIKAMEEAIVQTTRDAKQRIQDYKDIAGSAQKARQSVEAFKADMTDASAVLQRSQTLSEQLTKVRTVKRDYESCRSRASEIVENIKRERTRDNPNDKDIKNREEAFETARDTAGKAKDAILPAAHDVEVAKGVVDVYSPKGVRAHILDTVTPYLNARTAHYLGALSDGAIEAIWQTLTLTAAGEAREKFSIQVTHKLGGGSFATLSGGEKRKVRIACALALQDLVATRATKSLDLFIADEIDAALDVSSLERLMAVLDEKAKERGSVFIISHSDLRDWCSNVITVQKNEGVSELIAA